MNIKQASLSDLANELDRADIALAVGFSRKVERLWKEYRKAVWSEIKRRTPIDATAMTDAELLRQLNE